MPFDPEHFGYCPRSLWCRFVRQAGKPVTRIWVQIAGLFLIVILGLLLAQGHKALSDFEHESAARRSQNTQTLQRIEAVQAVQPALICAAVAKSETAIIAGFKAPAAVTMRIDAEIASDCQ